MRFFRVESPGLKEEARRGGRRLPRRRRDDEVAMVRNVTQAAAVVLSSLAAQRRGSGPATGRARRAGLRVGPPHASRTGASAAGASYAVVPHPVDVDDAGHRRRPGRHRVRRGRSGAGTGSRWWSWTSHLARPGSLLPVRRDLCARPGRSAALSFVDARPRARAGPRPRPARLGADFWAGTWHKWGFAPRGTSAPVGDARPSVSGIDPLVTSWNHGMPFPSRSTPTAPTTQRLVLPAGRVDVLARRPAGWAIAERAAALLDQGAAVVDRGRCREVSGDRAGGVRAVPAAGGAARRRRDRPRRGGRALPAAERGGRRGPGHAVRRSWLGAPRRRGLNRPRTTTHLADVLPTLLPARLRGETSTSAPSAVRRPERRSTREALDSTARSGGGDVVGVDDAVGVALLGEEPLPVLGEVRVDGVAGDDRVEAGGTTSPWSALGAQQPAQALGLLLAGAEGARDLDRDGWPRAGRRRSWRPWRPRAGRSRRAGRR